MEIKMANKANSIQTVFTGIIAVAVSILAFIEIQKNNVSEQLRINEKLANNIAKASIEDVKKSAFQNFKYNQIEETVNFLMGYPYPIWWSKEKAKNGKEFIQVKGYVKNKKKNNEFLVQVWNENKVHIYKILTDKKETYKSLRSEMIYNIRFVLGEEKKGFGYENDAALFKKYGEKKVRSLRRECSAHE